MIKIYLSHPEKIYSLSVRSAAEYCSVVWHNNLTQGQTYAREQLQIVSLKIILGSDGPRKDDGHFDYEKALTLCYLKSIFSRREARTVSFGKKFIQHPDLRRKNFEWKNRAWMTALLKILLWWISSNLMKYACNLRIVFSLSCSLNLILGKLKFL